MPSFKLNSISYQKGAFDFAMLILRLGFGITMMPHGYAKLMSFAEKSDKFMNFMGLSSPVSLSLTIFAELFCAGLIALGLLTRLATIPLIIATLVIVFAAHKGDIFDSASSGFFYLIVFTVILLLGPGKYSLDYALGKKRK